MKRKQLFALSTAIACIIGGCGGKDGAVPALYTELSTISDENGGCEGESQSEQVSSAEESEQVSSAEESEPSDTVVEIEIETSAKQEAFDAGYEEQTDDAKYYCKYYCLVYGSVTGEVTSSFNLRKFLKVYKSVEEETLDDYFSETCWIEREDGISLSMTPQEKLFPENNGSVYLWTARCIHAFWLIRQEYGDDENWDNPDSLKPQFHCHALYARQEKTPWNIEPYRTETNFVKVILYMGNPDS